jgi:uncharacterized DUF497 family protein
MLKFEFDKEKSVANHLKHGIDFLHAQALWDDSDLLEIRANSEDESRFLLIGKIGDKHWSAIVTYRGENIRLISVRRARGKEVLLYES